jgi:GT2 family glycosyltransferase
MRVSVVIPTFNSGSLVVEAVSSVLAQTQPPTEVIVVDDGSTDDTLAQLAPFGSSVRYIRKENGGVSSARNLGMAQASGEWIAFLDADDVWHPRKLEVQMAAIAKRPELGLLGGAMYHWPAETHPVIEPSVASEPIDVTFEELVVRNNIATSTVVVRADVLRSVGEFDRSLHGPEDFDLWLRIARRARIGFLPVELAGYRAATPNSLSKNAVRMETGLRAILAKLEADGAFRGRPVLRRKAWAYVRYSCGLSYREAGHQRTATSRFARSLFAWPFRLHSKPDGKGVDRLRMLASTLRMILTGNRSRVAGA